MSYILEALKKSEQQRRQGPVPDLQTIHLATPEAPAQRAWPYIIIVLLLVSLAFILGWLQPWKQHDAAFRSVPVPETVQDTALTNLPLTPPPAKSLAAQQAPPLQVIDEQPGYEEPARQQISAVTSEWRNDDPPSLEIQSVPHLSELPDLVRQAIPDMSFAGHVYSSSAAQRSVIINGRSMSEGDTVIRGLSIEQIISDGIVFNYQGQLFRMQILQDWSFE